jgi:PPK2 family polyphosphate:nucleotide phosphotransferase
VDTRKRLLKELVVRPGEAAGIGGRDPGWRGGEEFADLGLHKLEHVARDALKRGIHELSDAQELLWATDRYALLVVLQAMDAAGKDSAIEHVMKGVNPQGVHVVSFRKPSAEELDHDFLWRISAALPERGRIGIFNRSHYEEVVALKVHPEWLDAQRLPAGERDERFWQERYEDINAFEHHLARNGTKIVKLFLHVSKGVQKERFLARLDTPGKEWKFNPADVTERAHWDAYMQAFEDALSATSTEWAPWYVIPADDKKVTQALVALVIVDAITSLDLSWPDVSPEEHAENLDARKLLEAESDAADSVAAR